MSVNPVATSPLSATICSNEAYDFHGRDLTQAGTYSDTLQTINGCDSVIVLTLSVNPVYHDTINAEICEGSVYTENGFNESEAGTYTQNPQTINSCDSIVTLNLTVNSALTSIIDAEICEGTTYSENEFEQSEAGTYTQHLQTVDGCDSTIMLTLVVMMSLDDTMIDENAFIFYPNPAKDFVILEFETLHESERVQIFDIRGRRVKTAEAGAGKKQMQIDISDLSKGTYIIRFGNVAKKLIVG